MKASQIKRMIFEHYYSNNLSGRRMVRRARKAIKKLWDIEEYRNTLIVLPNETNLNEIYIFIKRVFLSRYKMAIDSDSSIDKSIKEERSYINNLTNFLYYPEEKEKYRNRDRWKIGTEYEDEYNERIEKRQREIKRYNDMIWIYELTGYDVSENKKDYLLCIAKDELLYSFGKDFFENENNKTLDKHTVASELLKIYSERKEEYPDGELYDYILRRMKHTVAICETRKSNIYGSR